MIDEGAGWGWEGGIEGGTEREGDGVGGWLSRAGPTWAAFKLKSSQLDAGSEEEDKKKRAWPSTRSRTPAARERH